jgi:hypothetical protein
MGVEVRPKVDETAAMHQKLLFVAACLSVFLVNLKRTDKLTGNPPTYMNQGVRPLKVRLVVLKVRSYVHESEVFNP